MKVDKFNREFKVGQLVCWSTSWTKGPQIGIVKRVCKQRIRVTYKWRWTWDNKSEWINQDVLQQPARLIILDDTLPSTLTMELLKQS